MFTLVPSQFFAPEDAHRTLAEVTGLKKDIQVGHIEIPQYDAVLIYAEDEDSSVSHHEIHDILDLLPSCTEYNKIVCSAKDGVLYLAIAQGKSLLLANRFEIQDFTTALYYVFLSLKSLQLNPEISTICWKGELGSEEEMTLYRYFKAVEKL